MHRTLKEDTTKPPVLTLRLQQKKFDWFCLVFNQFTYPRGFQTRCVNSGGDIKWHKDLVFIS